MPLLEHLTHSFHFNSRTSIFFVIIHPLSLSISIIFFFFWKWDLSQSLLCCIDMETNLYVDGLIFIMSLNSAVNTKYNVPFPLKSADLKKGENIRRQSGVKMISFGWDENSFSSMQALSGALLLHIWSVAPNSRYSNPADISAPPECCLALFLCFAPRTDFKSAVLSHVFHAKSLHIKEKLSQTAAGQSWSFAQVKNTNFSLSAAIDLLPGWVWANRLLKQPASICFVGLSLGPVLKNVFRFLCGFGMCEGSWTWLSTFYAKIFVCRKKIYRESKSGSPADRVCL